MEAIARSLWDPNGHANFRYTKQAGCWLRPSWQALQITLFVAILEESWISAVSGASFLLSH
jgi:hypothetical protein